MSKTVKSWKILANNYEENRYHNYIEILYDDGSIAIKGIFNGDSLLSNGSVVRKQYVSLARDSP